MRKISKYQYQNIKKECMLWYKNGLALLESMVENYLKCAALMGTDSSVVLVLQIAQCYYLK